MAKQEFDKDKLLEYWLDSANDDYETMNATFDAKKYNWSLFIGYYMIKKYLKAYYIIINKKFPPYTNSLLQLAAKSKLILSEDQQKLLETFTAFRVNKIYDDYKTNFKNRCTPEFTSYWIEQLKEFRIWIMELINS